MGEMSGEHGALHAAACDCLVAVIGRLTVECDQGLGVSSAVVRDACRMMSEAHSLLCAAPLGSGVPDRFGRARETLTAIVGELMIECFNGTGIDSARIRFVVRRLVGVHVAVLGSDTRRVPGPVTARLTEVLSEEDHFARERCA